MTQVKKRMKWFFTVKAFIILQSFTSLQIGRTPSADTKLAPSDQLAKALPEYYTKCRDSGMKQDVRAYPGEPVPSVMHSTCPVSLF